MHTDPVSIILGQSLVVFLFVSALTGIALALLLIYNPSLLVRINRFANRWISTRHIDRPLDRIISLEEWFYRHHRPLGILITLGAGYIITFFGLLFDRAAALQRLTRYVPANLANGLLDALVLGALIGAVTALLVGLFMWIRPSMLRGFEEISNKWVSSRHATRVLAIPRDHAEIYIAQHARSVGWLLLLGCLYLFFLTVRWLV